MRKFASLVRWSIIAAAIAAAGSAEAETALERGTYLVRGIAGCGNCHTTKDDDAKPITNMELAGGNQFNLPIGHVITPNITPDPETGIGRWTDDQITMAIREGKRPDGSMIGPVMPFLFLRQISDNDLKAIIAYLRFIPPVHHEVARTTYSISLPPTYGPAVAHVPEVSHEDRTAYGAYLTGPLGHCLECHTPIVQGKLDMAHAGAGGRPIPAFVPGGGVIQSRNITSSPTNGLGKWSNQEIKKAITSGVRMDGSQLVPTMGFAWYSHISDDDLDAIVVYLRTLKAVDPQP